MGASRILKRKGKKMPGMRYVILPEPVQLTNPVTGEVFAEEKPVAVPDLVHKLLSNPKWAESYTAIKSADAIAEAFKDKNTGDTVVLAEDDWNRLREAVDAPKIVAQTNQGMATISGFGYHPAVTRQLLPLLKSIVEAKDKAPQALKAVEG